MSVRAFKRWQRIIVGILVAVAVVGYGAVLFESRIERHAAMDWVPLAEQLAFEPTRSSNVALYPQYGFADLGADFKNPMSATWDLASLDPAKSSDEYLFVVADEPLFYGPEAAVRVFLCGHEIGRIGARAVKAPTGPFAAGLAREILQVPPEKALGYQFAVAEGVKCREDSRVTVRGALATWRIYRIGIVRETSRFTLS